MAIFNVCIESLSSFKSAYIFNRKHIGLRRDKEAIHFILKQIQINRLFIRLGNSTSAVGEYGEQEYHRSVGNVAGGRFSRNSGPVQPQHYLIFSTSIFYSLQRIP